MNPQEYPMVDLETEKRIYESLQEIKKGDYDLIDLQKNPNAFLDLYKE